LNLAPAEKTEIENIQTTNVVAKLPFSSLECSNREKVKK
jgi:hypothetical protein